MPIPDRRVLIVLATLVAAMTVASGLLLALEPGPTAAFPTIQLSSVGSPDGGAAGLFETDTALTPGRYSAIIIHDSGTLDGSTDTIANGQGYHFVIANGHGAGDGAIEAGGRWHDQLDGQFVTGANGDEPIASPAIGICLVGDTARQSPTESQARQLFWLVRQLQSRFEISGENVMPPAGHRFPHALFGRQLLSRQPR